MQEYIKKILGSGHNNNTVLIILNDEINDIIKIVKSLEDSGLLLKGVSQTFQNEVKEQKGGFGYIRCKFIRKSFNYKRNI